MSGKMMKVRYKLSEYQGTARVPHDAERDDLLDAVKARNENHFKGVDFAGVTVRHKKRKKKKVKKGDDDKYPVVKGKHKLKKKHTYLIELPESSERPAKRQKMVYGPDQGKEILALAKEMTKMEPKGLPRRWDIVDRDTAVKIAYEAMRNSWDGWGSESGVDEKASIRALYAGWGMGIGKTVMGRYLFDALTKHKPDARWMKGGRVFKYVYVQMNGGMKTHVLPILDRKVDAVYAVHSDTSAALRLLIGGLELDDVSAKRLLKRLDLSCDWSMSDVVKILREHWGVKDATPLGLFVHVDEVQTLVSATSAERFLGVRQGFTHYLYNSNKSQAAAEGVFPTFYFSGVVRSDLLKADDVDQTGKYTVTGSGQCTLVDIGLSPLEHAVDCLSKALDGKKDVDKFLKREDILHGLALTGHIPRAAVEWVSGEVDNLVPDNDTSLTNIDAGTLFTYVGNKFVTQYAGRVAQSDERTRQQFALDVLRGKAMNEVPPEYKLLAGSLTHDRLAAPPLIVRLVLSTFTRETDPTRVFAGDLICFKHYGNDVLPMKRMEWKGFEKATALTLAMSLSREAGAYAPEFRELFEFADTTKLGEDILSGEVKPSSWKVKTRKERLFTLGRGTTKWVGGNLAPRKVWLSAEGDALADITLVLKRQGGKKLLLFVQCKTEKKYAWSEVQENVKKLADATAELGKKYERVYALALSRVEVAKMQEKKKGRLDLELPVMVLGPTYFPPVLAACMRYAK